MHLVGIELHNWQCFRGKQRIDLKPIAYGVTCRHAGDPERSNWGGKSALVEAVDFALYDRLNKDRGMGADGWVTDGESEGGVKLFFDDGAVVERSRKKTTQLYFTQGGRPAAKKDEAQKLLLEYVGLSAEDFPYTCYFRQRQMARLVLTEPGKRMETVAAWFRLGPLEKAEEAVATAAATLAWKAETLRGKLNTLQAARERELAGQDPDLLAGEEERLDRALEGAAGRSARIQDELEKAGRATAGAGASERLKALVAEGTALRNEVDEDWKPGAFAELDKAHREASAAAGSVQQALTLLERDLKQKRSLVEGDWDGACPVAGIACPAKQQIDARVVENKAATKKVQKGVAELQEKRDRLDREARGSLAQLQEHKRKQERLEMLRKEAAHLQELAELHDAYDGPDAEALRHALDDAQRHHQHLGVKRDVARRVRALVAQCEAEEAKVSQELATVERQLATHREAKVIFGKQGAQRRVAEGALAEIERGANAALRACAIALDVEVRWSREGGGPAKTCDACGHPFPTSAKAKECERCGTARGPHLVNKLDILLSDQSGAAEDLASAFIQLGAARWLKDDRGSRWGTALIDEAFGQLDASHRRAFAAHLAGMLRSEYGFEQAFVIAHHPSVLDALPGRIEIDALAPGHSTLRVVA